jgi:signal transduction histidine kinase
MRIVPYTGELPQIVLFMDSDSLVERCDKSLAGDTFSHLPDISRESPHAFLHNDEQCIGDCELRGLLKECIARLESETIIDVEMFDGGFGRLLRLRFLGSAGNENSQAFAILHVVDITAGREVTHSLLDTNRRLGVLFKEKESELSVSEEKNVEHCENLRDMNRHLKMLSTRLIMAQEQERNRISSDLHDGVGQHLSLSKYCLEQAIEEAGLRPDKSGLDDALKRTLRHLESSVQEVRRISRNLKPSMLEEFGLVATLELLVHEFIDAHSTISATIDIRSADSKVPTEKAVAVMRILQEATNNVSRHAAATAVVFDIAIERDTISMEISDNGVGFEPATRDFSATNRTRYGINNMIDRARSSGGIFEISSKPDEGTTIRVNWPGSTK